MQNTNKKILLNISIVFVISGIILISGCINTEVVDRDTQILEIVMASGVLVQGSYFLPDIEKVTDEFMENSSIYVCGKIITAIGGSSVDVELYKNYPDPAPLNISIQTFPGGNLKSGDAGRWVCVNLSDILSHGNYSVKFSLDDKYKAISFNIPEVKKEVTEMEAVKIANATEEVREFLNIYPGAKITAFKDCCANIKIKGGECKCVRDFNDPWVVITGEKEHVFVGMAINSTTGEIISKYPKLVYIKNSKYCEQDSDCKYVVNDDAPACDNFIYYSNYPEDNKSCTCMNDTCAVVVTKPAKINQTNQTANKTNITENKSGEQEEEYYFDPDDIGQPSEIVTKGPISTETIGKLIAEDKVAFFFLHNPGCSHCVRAEKRLDEIQKSFGQRVIIYELWVEEPESEPWSRIALNEGLNAYPFTLAIGAKSVASSGELIAADIGMTAGAGTIIYEEWQENICAQFKTPPGFC